ncbi:hypothetical protein [Lignipirellula cremea]|uniref:Uncharacterized protein n=1 Tax=Lignipirellula cremea TaxID=2528010 RepID=A0A518DR96_9BACT|nr:hypothetical protein [Lignipirellula cremea]QDU94344.1 hypothetical protein Pla8534_21330 [Lignipirellula cremea]
MPTLPTIEELKTLPLRALVAYGARAALRVEPLRWVEAALHESPYDFHPAAQACVLAASFARGETMTGACATALQTHALARSIKSSPTRRAVLAAGYAADAAAKASFADYARQAANYSADAAGMACNIDYVFTPKLNATVIAEDVAYSAANAVIASCGANDSEALARAAVRDYKKLRSLRLGSFPELGKCVDLGPLEQLWPEGASRWLSRAGKLSPPADRAALAIWYSAGMKRHKEVRVCTLICQCFNLSPDELPQALATLQAEQLISADTPSEPTLVAMK